MTTTLCQYCSHRTTAPADRCSYCGAPLESDTAEPALVSNSATETGTLPNSWFPEQKSIAWLGPIRRRRFFPWVLGAVAVAVVVLLVLLVINIVDSVRHLHFNVDTDIGGFGGGGGSAVTQFLPPQLRDSSNCRGDKGATGDYTCELNAESPLLMGDGLGSRGLTFRVGVVPRGNVAAIVDQWRGSAQEVVESGPVFAAVGSSDDVRYLNPATGLRLQTDSLPGRRAAESFLGRSGLVQMAEN